jgi:predicted aconitase
MKLNDEEKAILAGEQGWVRQQAMRQQIEVGTFFDAADLVPVAQAHIMADTESLGEAGVEYLEKLAAAPEAERRVVIPTITDPRGADFNTYKRIKQDEAFVALERRAIDAFRALGVLMTDTCINYQTVMPPVLGEHMAFGDTGVVIYSNSVLGARSNYEGGPSALAAALTGRTPRYGFHLDACRRGTKRFVIKDAPRDWTDWGALGGLVGRRMESYFDVPVIEGAVGHPGSDDLKHFGAAMASYGSTAMFHMLGVTPEARDLGDVFDGTPPAPVTLTHKDIDDFLAGYAKGIDEIDVVVFAAPQLSVPELEKLAGLLKGRSVKGGISLLVATNPENKHAADRMGFTDAIEGAGGVLMEGVCFYQMHARELGEANGWTRLMTNSAKLTNIIGGYGYKPMLATMEACVETACTGRIAR